MKFFFPDSQDFVDDTFDFESETRSDVRVRQRDDRYAHEIFSTPPYDGILVSKAVVDGIGGGSGKYSAAQRQRFLRVGVREYFRLVNRPLATIGDCGAFTYVKEARPPYSPPQVADFYEDCGFDYGLSVDHLILSYRADLDDQLTGIDLVPESWRSRQNITLELAEEFLSYCGRRQYRFTPIGVAQGWSPASYTHAVDALRRLGYRYIAFGGFVPLKTADILACLEAVSVVKNEATEFHLLGITRCENVAAFSGSGVVSFDSTSPLRKAFKDDKNNYYAPERTYTALRVPQIDANPELLRSITAGEVKQELARELEQRCLQTLIRDAPIGSFPICATAFIANDEREQREQFILVNSTKPLPKGLIYELLPTTEMKLPSLLQRRRFPVQLLARMNADESSPLRGRIRTPTAPSGVVQDNSVLKMLENSLSYGVLYRFRDPATNSSDAEAMLQVLNAFWRAAAAVFPNAWGLPPVRSRLMHGAGIVSMGFLMDAIAERHRDVGMPAETQFREDLAGKSCDRCPSFADWNTGSAAVAERDLPPKASPTSFDAKCRSGNSGTRRKWRNSLVSKSV